MLLRGSQTQDSQLPEMMMELQRFQEPFYDGPHVVRTSQSGVVFLGTAAHRARHFAATLMVAAPPVAHRARHFAATLMVAAPPVIAAIVFWSMAGTAMARDGATEALELRYHSELAIAEESAEGDPELAGVMRDILSGMLMEHLVARDETVTLDMVDAAFVEAQFSVAEAMEEPGVAMALAVFVGPGTGYEHGIRTSIANLADFRVRKEGQQVTGKALDAHERVMQHHLDKLGVLDDTTVDRIDDLDKATEQAVKEAAKAAELVVKETTKALDQTEKEATASEKEAQKAVEEDAKEQDGTGGGGPPPEKGKNK